MRILWVRGVDCARSYVLDRPSMTYLLLTSGEGEDISLD